MSDAPRYPDTDGKSLNNQVRELKDYIINLHRYIRYALNNIDVRNMTLSTAASVRKVGDIDASVSEIIQDVDRISLSVTTKDGKVSLALNGAGGGGGTIDLTGMVTFENLAVSDGKTIINADNITTGKISAVGIELEGYWSDNYYRKVIIDKDDFSFFGGTGSDSLDLRSRTLDTGTEFYSLYHTLDETLVHGSNVAYVGLIHTRLAEGDDYNDKLFIGGGLPGMAEVPLDLQITSTGNLGVYSGGVISITGSPIKLNGAEPFTKSSVIPIANGGTGAKTANAAATNLYESGTWTPKLICEGSGAVNPTYTHSYNGIAGSPIGRYTRIGNLVYVQCYIPALISAAGTGYAAISGLPYAGRGDMDSTLVNRGYANALNGSVSTLNPVLKVSSGGTTAGYRIPEGSGGYNWKVNTSTSPKGSLIQFAGIYRIG